MLTLSEVWRKIPNPPPVGAWIASMLEVTLLVCLMMHGSIIGILAWVGYFYFSALRFVVFGE